PRPLSATMTLSMPLPRVKRTDAWVAPECFRILAPSAQELADKYSKVKEELAAVTEKLTQEQAVSTALRKIVAELDLELMQAQEKLEQSGNVTRLPSPRRRVTRR
ncbi:hypothetical protein AB0M67_28645, partial [Streptomyces sp. NPDC051662]